MPLDHIVVIMQENHSFDNYFGKLNKPKFYGSEIDGVTDELSNPDWFGRSVRMHHETQTSVLDTFHDWNSEHFLWNKGKNNNFVKLNGERSMGYYEETELGFYYELANKYAVADRYFCSVLGPTFPNRFFLIAGTAFGHISNDYPKNADDFNQKTIFDTLDEYGVSWRYYADWDGYLKLFGKLYKKDRSKIAKLSDYETDLANGTLPHVVFLESKDDVEDEHPPANIQKGQAWVEARVKALMASSAWESSALFLTYDENGGLFDHVPPPEACAPDSTVPQLNSEAESGGYDRYGFRVPFVAVSPYVKSHFVSHQVYDHTSILKFIETKFNLPALTERDANANDLTDLFDFSPR